MSIRIFHTADLHLGAEYKSFQEKANQLKQEAFNSLEKMVNYVTDPNNEIHIMIIAGDLFDIHKPDLTLVDKVRDLLLNVTQKNIKLYILPGNHDSYSYKNSIFRTEEFPGTLIKSPQFSLVDELEINNEKIFIYSGIYEVNNPHKRILKDFQVMQQPGAHLGILHGTLEMREITIPDRDLPFSYEEFAATGLNYLALGHFHKYFEKQTNKEHKLAYCGSIIPRKINEYDEKYALIAEIRQNNTVEIEKLSFSRIKSEKKVINTIKENIEDIKSLISLIQKFRNPHLILDIEINGVSNFPVDNKFLTDILSKDFFFIRISNNVKFIESSILKQLKAEETIRGLFFKKLSEHRVLSDENHKILNNAINLGLREFTDAGQYNEPEFNFIKGEHKIEID